MTGNRFTILALAGLFALIVCLRLHTYNEPLERDLTTYAVIAHELLEGKTLYSEMWDHKPPAIHVTYATAELIAGYGRNSIFLMNVAAALATLLACYFAGSAAGGGQFGGLMAATLWAVLSGDPTIEGNQPNTEVFLNAFLTIAFALVIRIDRSDQVKLRRVLLIGSLFAIASLYKQVAIVPASFLICAHVICTPAALRKQALADSIRIGAVGALAWVIVFGYFTLRGSTDAFIDATFTYNQYYAGSLWHNLTLWSQAPQLNSHAIILGLLIAAICLAGLIFGIVNGPRRPWILLLAIFLGAHLAVLLPGQFFPHYYQLWLPPLVIGTGWTFAILKRVLPGAARSVAYAAAGCILIALMLSESQFYQTAPEIWSIRKYGRVFVETDRLALTVGKLLRKNETFYEWGSESELYFITKQDPLSGIMFTDPLLSGPLRVELLQRLSADLQRARPDLIILEKQTVARTPATHPFLTWVKKNYRPISAQHGFLLLARKQSALEQEGLERLNQTPRATAL